jgi:hypothetical protein
MWNPETIRIYCTRDIIWLKKYVYTGDSQARENEKLEEVEDSPQTSLRFFTYTDNY